jgi:hypothetical protein
MEFPPKIIGSTNIDDMNSSLETGSSQPVTRATNAKRNTHSLAYGSSVFAVAVVLAMVSSTFVDGGYGNFVAAYIVLIGAASLLLMSLIAGFVLRKCYGTIPVGLILLISISAPVAALVVVGVVVGAVPKQSLCSHSQWQKPNGGATRAGRHRALGNALDT